MQATEIALQSDLRQSSNGVRYTAFGENNLENADLDRIVQAVPATIAASLGKKAYYFVPLALTERPIQERATQERAIQERPIQERPLSTPLGGEIALIDAPTPVSSLDAQLTGELAAETDTLIATTYTTEFSDRAICHRNVRLPGKEGSIEGVFISTRLLGDRFALAFEFFINVGHAFVDIAGVPDTFTEAVWKQALVDVRGETSQDAWESRALSLANSEKVDGKVHVAGAAGVDEKAKSDFLDAAFSDAVAIYLLSLAIDFDYAELRERDYPLLAPHALAERLRIVAKLFPPNAGYEFAIRYRRRK